MRVGILGRTNFILLLFLLGICGGVAHAHEDPWNPSQLLEPQGLGQILKAPSKNNSPVLIHVGFQFLFKSGHIPGSIYAGPARDERGLASLRAALKNIPRTREVVIYCGCCPFGKCPNVRPAFRLVKEMGFKNIKVLHLQDNFQKNWMTRGYPVIR